MNIFFTDKDPEVAARNLCDQHVIKMILESAQLLCTAHRVLDGIKLENLEILRKNKVRKVTRYYLEDACRNDGLYKATHVNHPCSIWVRESSANYYWLYGHMRYLNSVYLERFGKTHKVFREPMCNNNNNLTLAGRLASLPINITSSKEISLPPLAMPDKYKEKSVTQSYKNYMIGEKITMGKRPARWTAPHDVPEWYIIDNPHYQIVRAVTTENDKLKHLYTETKECQFTPSKTE